MIILSFIKSFVTNHPFISIFVAVVTCSGLQYLITPKPVPQVQEKIVYKDKIVTVYKTKTEKVTITKPDGTKIVKDTTTASNTQSNETTKINTIPSLKSKYSLGVSYAQTYPLKPWDYTNVGFQAGIRLADTPFFLTLGAKLDRTLSLGISYEF
jgi:hypothetical protein